MVETDTKCRVLIVDDDLQEASRIAHELSDVPPARIGGRELVIEISNSAYFVERRLKEAKPESPPWDVIFSDVFMPCPCDKPKAAPCAEATHEPIRGPAGKSWSAHIYHYSWNEDQVSAKHGGFLIAEAFLAVRKSRPSYEKTQLVLMSNRLFGEDRDRVLSLLSRGRPSMEYYDKAQWEDAILEPSRPQIDSEHFVQALIQAIRRAESSQGLGLYSEHSVPDSTPFLCMAPRMQEIMIQARGWAGSKRARVILLNGETGVGKSRLAEHLHSLRVKQLGISDKIERVAAPNLPCTVFDSLLFGHEKGAFTGADEAHNGHVFSAAKGTLFFDEIGDVPLLSQGKLLDLFDGRGYRRVGGKELLTSLPAFFLCATNCDLDVAVETVKLGEIYLNASRHTVWRFRRYVNARRISFRSPVSLYKKPTSRN
ncbi:MAG: sigma 54-interacting transcriptional regulator [Planctomycetota bacterium]|nr:sigma 54-interacting transcriptional regulator [Planctomycetota bacterium]